MARRKIEGSTAIVTGASAGIGSALARELAATGARVVLVARREDRLRELAEEIATAGGTAEYVAGDITLPATREAALARAVDRFGGLDILVNNAGVGAMGPFQTADPDRLRRIFEVNFFAPLEMIRSALPVLEEAARPIIVNVASILGHVGLPNVSEYSASKFALRGFSEVLRAELFKKRIDVMVVSPATVDSEMWTSLLEDTGASSWRARRGSTPEQIAAKTVRAIRRGRREVFPGFVPKFARFFNRLSPAAVAWVMARRH